MTPNDLSLSGENLNWNSKCVLKTNLNKLCNKCMFYYIIYIIDLNDFGG